MGTPIPISVYPAVVTIHQIFASMYAIGKPIPTFRSINTVLMRIARQSHAGIFDDVNDRSTTADLMTIQPAVII